MVRDITEQKRLEDELKRGAQQLQRLNLSLAQLSAAADASNRAKSEFLANMSHEIRTPMTAVLGFLELLRGELRDSAQLAALDTIQRNADFLLELINDLLDLSKIEAHKFELETAAVSPAALLTEIESLMALRAAVRGLRLFVSLPERVPASIRTDPKRVKQILINLVGNAIKFTDEGEVRLVLAWDLVGERGQITLSVEDTGIGMTPGGSRAGLRALHAGFQRGFPPRGWHRTGPDHQPAFGRAVGRPAGGRKHFGLGQHLPSDVAGPVRRTA